MVPFFVVAPFLVVTFFVVACRANLLCSSFRIPSRESTCRSFWDRGWSSPELLSAMAPYKERKVLIYEFKGTSEKSNPTTANIQQVANTMTSKCRTMLTLTMRGRWWPNYIYKFSFRIVMEYKSFYNSKLFMWLNNYVLYCMAEISLRLTLLHLINNNCK